MRPSVRLRARQWSRASWALAGLFASLPLSCRLFLGEWGFESAGGVAALFLVAGIYLHILARRAARALPDPAEMLDRRRGMARLAQAEAGRAILTGGVRPPRAV